MDQTTKKQIDLLHPSVREEVTKIIDECDLALTGRAKVRITQGLRTFQEQEDDLRLNITTAFSDHIQPKPVKIEIL